MRLDICPPDDVRRQGLLEIVDRLRREIEDGVALDLLVLVGREDGFSTRSAWRDPFGLVGALGVAHHDAICRVGGETPEEGDKKA